MNSKKISPEQVDPAGPKARGLSNDLIDYSRQLFNRPTDAGSRFAPIGAGEQQGLDAIQQNMGGMTQNQGQGQALIGDILSGNRLSPDTNPYLSQVLGSLRTNASDNLGVGMNALDAAFGRSGMANSSARSTEATNLADKSVSSLNDTIANMLFGQYNNGLNEQMQTLGMLPSFNSGNINSLVSALSALSLPRQLEQQGKDFEYNAAGDNALLIAQILGSQPGFNFMSPEYAPSMFSQVTSGLGALGQGIGALIPGN